MLTLLFLDLKKKYSQTLLYWHPPNTDTSLAWTVCFVTGKESPYITFSLKPTLHGHPDNMDILHVPLSLLTKFDFICISTTTMFVYSQPHVQKNNISCLSLHFWTEITKW